jgi:hypothetical protein
MPVRVLHHKFKLILAEVFLFGAISNFILATGVQANLRLQPQQFDCRTVAFDDIVQTPQGHVFAGTYCQTQVSNRKEELASDKQTIPWGIPYWLNDNICRNRVADTVCLTPSEATKLRWNIPPN